MRKRIGQVWKVTAKESQALLPSSFWLEIFKPNKKHKLTESEIKTAIYKKYGLEVSEKSLENLVRIEKLM